MPTPQTKPKAVAFSGHRSFKAFSAPTLFDENYGCDTMESLRPTLAEAIGELYKVGYRTFLSGMAEGFDLMAAQEVLRLRRVYSDIELVAVVPHPEQSSRYGDEPRQTYEEVIDCVDSVVCIKPSYSVDCFHRRNDYLVDNSDVLVCFFNGTKGGTAYTVAKARRLGHRIVNLWLKLNHNC